MKAIRLLAAATALIAAGCSTAPTGGGTASLPTPGPSVVMGRDLGRGEATSGGISSMDTGGNAADWSVYDARRFEAQR